MPASPELVWHVETHEHKEHTADWYWALGLITVAGAVLSVWFGNILLALILLIGVSAIVTLKLRGPREHQVRMDARGVTLDGTLYPWKSIHTFWVNADDMRGGPCVYLTTHSLLTPRITVPLDSREHADEVRGFLKQFAQEEEQTPHFGEHLAEMFGL